MPSPLENVLTLAMFKSSDVKNSADITVTVFKEQASWSPLFGIARHLDYPLLVVGMPIFFVKFNWKLIKCKCVYVTIPLIRYSP